MAKPMRPTHFEIGGKNPEKLKKFYEEIFGWKIEKWESPDEKMDYWLITTGAKQMDRENPGIDGGMTKDKPFAPLTIEVGDLDGTSDKIKKMGGKFLTEKMDIPKVGTMFYFEDPEGNKFGVIHSMPM
ncbi:MAG: VOC family protein [Candidatus Pacearchaeota archaeon]